LVILDTKIIYTITLIYFLVILIELLISIRLRNGY